MSKNGRSKPNLACYSRCDSNSSDQTNATISRCKFDDDVDDGPIKFGTKAHIWLSGQLKIELFKG